jgi:hypothetical protein
MKIAVSPRLGGIDSMTYWLLTLSFLLLPVLSPSSQAATQAPPPAPPSDYQWYQEMLQIAQRKADHMKALKAATGPEALSTSLVTSVLGRYYQVGDQWDVLAWQQSSDAAAKTSAPTRFRGRVGSFHYEVIDVKPGNPAQVTVRITQKVGPKVDPRVIWLDLTMSDRFAQSKKVYHLANENTYSASPNGLHTAVSVLELFPLDVPDIYTAEKLTPPALPELPPTFQKQAEQAGYSATSIDLKQSAWFQQEDLFGRPIEVLWQHGDLWPSYMKTPGGVAILVRQ